MERNGAATRLRDELRHWRERKEPSVELGPASAYEAVTRQMVESLAADIQEIKARMNGLLFMVAGGLLIDVALRIGSHG